MVTVSATAGSPWPLQAPPKAKSASEKIAPPCGLPWKLTMWGASVSAARQYPGTELEQLDAEPPPVGIGRDPIGEAGGVGRSRPARSSRHRWTLVVPGARTLSSRSHGVR